MSDKKESIGTGCGRVFGFWWVCSLYGGFYGQILKWAGCLQCDWWFLWGPALGLTAVLFLLFAVVGLVLSAQEK